MRSIRCRKRSLAVFALAAVVALGAMAGTAYAFYTDTNEANGMVPFSYEPAPPDTEIIETSPDGMSKVIAVRNTGEVDAMVRVMVKGPSQGVSYRLSAADDDKSPMPAAWTSQVYDEKGKVVPADPWQYVLYYTEPVAPGESTPAFRLNVTVDGTAQVPASFDVVVIQQAINARGYDEATGALGIFADGPKFFKDPLAAAQDGE